MNENQIKIQSEFNAILKEYRGRSTQVGQLVGQLFADLDYQLSNAEEKIRLNKIKLAIKMHVRVAVNIEREINKVRARAGLGEIKSCHKLLDTYFKTRCW